MQWNITCSQMIRGTLLAGVLSVSSILPAGAQESTSSAEDWHNMEELKPFVVEIKEHKSTNKQNNVDPFQDPTIFSRGDTFVLNGTIYVDGSIQPGHKREPLPGSRTLGTYIQRGVFTENSDQFGLALQGAQDVPSAVAFSTELLIFDDGSTILMDGLWPNAYHSVTRVVQGGTGRFRDVIGTVLEENIGEDLDTFCNLRLTFRIRRAKATGHGR